MSESYSSTHDRTGLDAPSKRTLFARLRVCTTKWVNTTSVSDTLWAYMKRTGLDRKSILQGYATLRLAQLEKWWDALLADTLANLTTMYAEHKTDIEALQALPLLDNDPIEYVTKATPYWETL